MDVKLWLAKSIIVFIWEVLRCIGAEFWCYQFLIEKLIFTALIFYLSRCERGVCYSHHIQQCKFLFILIFKV